MYRLVKGFGHCPIGIGSKFVQSINSYGIIAFLVQKNARGKNIEVQKPRFWYRFQIWKFQIWKFLYQVCPQIPKTQTSLPIFRKKPVQKPGFPFGAAIFPVFGTVFGLYNATSAQTCSVG